MNFRLHLIIIIKQSLFQFSEKDAQHTEVYRGGIDVFKVPASRLLKEITDLTGV